MSQTKNTLLLILKQEISDLHQGVIDMNEQSLIKQVAKLRVIYNITRHENALELVYGYIALCEYYVSKQLYEPAVKNLMEALEIKECGDIYYQLGLCYYNLKKSGQAVKMLERCLKTQWIQPSLEHQLTTQLEALNYLQKIFYERIQNSPNKRNTLEEKLINLSYEKIQLTKKFDSNKNQERGENYYYSLAMADLAQIYFKLGEDMMGLEKIKTAIGMFEGEKEDDYKLKEFYLLSAELNEKVGRYEDSLEAVEKGMQLMDLSKPGQLTETQQELYYLLIRKTLQV